MALKNKEINKLFDAVELYFDSWCLPSLITAFMVCDDAIEGEIAAIKAELTEANQYKDIYRNTSNSLRSAIFERGDELRKANNQIESLKKMIDELKEKLNNERKHGEDLADVNGQLASENADLKEKTKFLENSRTGWRSRAQHAEKRVSDLVEELNQARNSTELHLRKENSELRTLKEDLSYGHEFKFGDKVFVPWSDIPYMYIKTSLMYNPRTETLVYVGKTQHLKWFGEKFEIK